MNTVFKTTDTAVRDHSSLCLANARLILPDTVLHGAVSVENGTITAVAEGDHVPAGAVDCHGDYVLPGLIELHTDNLERHIQPRPRVDWPHAAAIAAHDAELAVCGITTVFDALRVGSVTATVKGRDARYARSLACELHAAHAHGLLRINHRIHLRAEICSETLIEELAEFASGDGVGIISLMDHTPGQRQFRDIAKYKAYVMGKNAMSDSDFDALMSHLHTLRARHGDAQEAAAVAAAARLGAVLASHDDTTADQVATSAGYGIRMAEFPTTPEAAQHCRDHGIAIMMGAPNLIRGGSHSGNVSAQDLAEAGLLDILSSDYVPAALLHAAFHLGTLWDDLPRAIRTVTDAPARATRLTTKGALRAGLDADLIRVSLSGRVPVTRGVWVAGRRVA